MKDWLPGEFFVSYIFHIFNIINNSNNALSMGRDSYNSYYNRRRRALKESRNAAQGVVAVFADRLGALCNDLEWLRDCNFEAEGWTDNDEIRLANIAKNARRLSDMYTSDDAFIPEISYENGYEADKAFHAKSMKLSYLEFPEALDFIADMIEDILQECDAEAAWDVMVSYIPLVRLFLSQLRKDYSI